MSFRSPIYRVCTLTEAALAAFAVVSVDCRSPFDAVIRGQQTSKNSSYFFCARVGVCKYMQIYPRHLYTYPNTHTSARPECRQTSKHKKESENRKIEGDAKQIIIISHLCDANFRGFRIVQISFL